MPGDQCVDNWSYFVISYHWVDLKIHQIAKFHTPQLQRFYGFRLDYHTRPFGQGRMVAGNQFHVAKFSLLGLFHEALDQGSDITRLV